MKRFSPAVVALLAVALLLVAWGSREMLLGGHEQYERKRCCQRLRVCWLEMKDLAAAGRVPPATLREWAAQEPRIAELFRADLDCYELLAPAVLQEKAAPATEVVLRETKPTHAGTLHALFADGAIGAAPAK